MPVDSILDLARHVNPKVEMKHISPLHGGFSSQAYKIDVDGNLFVLLVERQGSVSDVNYGHAYVVLTLLQKHAYKHAPQPLWLKNDHKALAITFFEGLPSDKLNFHEAHVDPKKLAIKVMDSLLGTASITLGEYELTAKKHSVQLMPVETTMDAAKKYGTVWFETVKQSCPDADIVAWLEQRVERSVKMASSVGNSSPVFGHGDPSNPNILIRQDGSFILIDWDSARFHCVGPEWFVAYTTHLTDFMKPYRETLIGHVAKKLNVTVEELTHKVHEFRRFNEVFDVNWAAMMMAKVNAGEIPGDISEFRKIAQERIKIYEASFER